MGPVFGDTDGMAHGGLRLVGLLLGCAVVGAASAAACTSTVESAAPPGLDRCVFERDVYPVLVRDCGFPACHGAPERFFRVYAPGRTRLREDSGAYGPATAEEVQATYERARSMVAAVGRPEDSLLLRKPLEGGAHRGLDAAGRNVYASGDDPAHAAVAAWVRGQAPPCE